MQALQVATRNAARLLDAARPGGALNFAHGDWYAALSPALRFDAIVSNRRISRAAIRICRKAICGSSGRATR